MLALVVIKAHIALFNAILCLYVALLVIQLLFNSEALVNRWVKIEFHQYDVSLNFINVLLNHVNSIKWIDVPPSFTIKLKFIKLPLLTQVKLSQYTFISPLLLFLIFPSLLIPFFAIILTLHFLITHILLFFFILILTLKSSILLTLFKFSFFPLLPLFITTTPFILFLTSLSLFHSQAEFFLTPAKQLLLILPLSTSSR